MNDYKDHLTRAEEFAPALSQLRGALHRIPEPGNGEFRTAALVESELQRLGLETYRCTETAVVGVLRGALPGKTAALRADMDALPLDEDTGCAFPSENKGWMHACGHDFHMTAALGAARLLSEDRECLPGTVKFFFQPDEEGDGGAARMISAGCMEDPHVDAVFGAHVAPDLPAGTVGVRYGKFYAASNIFDITLHGKSAHGAEPENGIDALGAAARLLPALKKVREEMEEKHGRVIISTGALHAGNARNVIAERAELHGIIRTLGPDARRETVAAVRAAALAVAAETGTRSEIDIRGSHPGIVNHDGMSRLAEDTALALFGARRVVRIEKPTMTSEDFGCFIENTPGCFYHIGVGGDYPLHSARFLPDTRLLMPAAALHAAVICRFLEGKK